MLISPFLNSRYKLKVKLFEISESWTVPSNVLPLGYVDGSAAGSGGGGAYTNGGGGGGGGGGTAVEKVPFYLIAGETLSATIGLGGAPGISGLSPTAGSVGGDTSLIYSSLAIGLYISNSGQGGGIQSTALNGGNGGAGTRALIGESSVPAGGTGGAYTSNGNNGTYGLIKPSAGCWYPGGSGSGGAGSAATNANISGGQVYNIAGAKNGAATSSVGVGGLPGASRWCKINDLGQALGPKPYPYNIEGSGTGTFGYGMGGAGATGGTNNINNPAATTGTNGFIRLYYFVEEL